MKTFRNRLSMLQVRWQRDEDGQVLIMFTLWVFVLFGFMGLIIDLGILYYNQREIKHIAESAALAGASQIDEKILGSRGLLEGTFKGFEIGNCFALARNLFNLNLGSFTSEFGIQGGILDFKSAEEVAREVCAEYGVEEDDCEVDMFPPGLNPVDCLAPPSFPPLDTITVTVTREMHRLYFIPLINLNYQNNPFTLEAEATARMVDSF